MKRIITTLFAGLLFLQLSTANAAEWLTDLPKAQAKAKAEKKLVLLDFTGSDWCPACKMLERDVFSKKDFLNYAKTNLVLVLVDFPADKPQSQAQKDANSALAKQNQIEGYPTIIVMNAEQKVLWKQLGYGGDGVKAFIAELEKAKKKS